jgi:hypothetical protein
MNRAVITVGPGFGAVSLVELFAGCNISVANNYKSEEGVTKAAPLFSPWDPVNASYVLPDVIVTTDLGDIAVLGIGGAPTSPEFANLVSLHFFTVDGKIKMEVNGGGINANYTVKSGTRSIVEIDGVSVAPTGTIGGDTSSGQNEIVITSLRDDVQLVLLPSPL